MKLTIIPLLVLVLLSIACSDSTGITTAGDALFRESACLFDDTTVRQIEIIIDPVTLSNVALGLYTDPAGEKVYALASSFMFDGEILTNIGIRTRGNTSKSNFKRQFKLSFDCKTAYTNDSPDATVSLLTNDDRRFHGVKKLNLRASQNDPTMLRETVSAAIFRACGVPAPRTGFARVFINGEYWGLYTIVEQIDNTFLKTRFNEKSGNLYKAVYGSAGSRFNPANMDGFELKNNGDELGDTSGLAAFFTSLQTADGETTLGSILSGEAFINYMAAAVLTGHWDSLIWLQNNDYLYHHSDSHFRIIAWDMDNTLGSGRGWGFETLESQIYSFSASDNYNLLFKKLLAVASWKNEYENKINTILKTLYNTNTLQVMIDGYKNLIATAVAQDPRKHVDWRYPDSATATTAWDNAFTTLPADWTGGGFGVDGNGLLEWLNKREAQIRSMLTTGDSGGSVTLNPGPSFVTKGGHVTFPIGTPCVVSATVSCPTGIDRIEFQYNHSYKGTWTTCSTVSNAPYSGTILVPFDGYNDDLYLRAVMYTGSGQKIYSQSITALAYVTNYASPTDNGDGTWTFRMIPDYYYGVASNQNVYLAGEMTGWVENTVYASDTSIIPMTNNGQGVYICVAAATSGQEYRILVDVNGDGNRQDNPGTEWFFNDWFWDVANPLYNSSSYNSILP